MPLIRRNQPPNVTPVIVKKRRWRKASCSSPGSASSISVPSGVKKPASAAVLSRENEAIQSDTSSTEDILRLIEDYASSTDGASDSETGNHGNLSTTHKPDPSASVQLTTKRIVLNKPKMGSQNSTIPKQVGISQHLAFNKGTTGTSSESNKSEMLTHDLCLPRRGLHAKTTTNRNVKKSSSTTLKGERCQPTPTLNTKTPTIARVEGHNPLNQKSKIGSPRQVTNTYRATVVNDERNTSTFLKPEMHSPKKALKIESSKKANVDCKISTFPETVKQSPRELDRAKTSPRTRSVHQAEILANKSVNNRQESAPTLTLQNNSNRGLVQCKTQQQIMPNKCDEKHSSLRCSVTRSPSPAKCVRKESTNDSLTKSPSSTRSNINSSLPVCTKPASPVKCAKKTAMTVTTTNQSPPSKKSPSAVQRGRLNTKTELKARDFSSTVSPTRCTRSISAAESTKMMIPVMSGLTSDEDEGRLIVDESRDSLVIDSDRMSEVSQPLSPASRLSDFNEDNKKTILSCFSPTSSSWMSSPSSDSIRVKSPVPMRPLSVKIRKLSGDEIKQRGSSAAVQRVLDSDDCVTTLIKSPQIVSQGKVSATLIDSSDVNSDSVTDVSFSETSVFIKQENPPASFSKCAKVISPKKKSVLCSASSKNVCKSPNVLITPCDDMFQSNTERGNNLLLYKKCQTKDILPVNSAEQTNLISSCDLKKDTVTKSGSKRTLTKGFAIRTKPHKKKSKRKNSNSVGGNEALSSNQNIVTESHDQNISQETLNVDRSVKTNKSLLVSVERQSYPDNLKVPLLSVDSEKSSGDVSKSELILDNCVTKTRKASPKSTKVVNKNKTPEKIQSETKEILQKTDETKKVVKKTRNKKTKTKSAKYKIKRRSGLKVKITKHNQSNDTSLDNNSSGVEIKHTEDLKDTSISTSDYQADFSDGVNTSMDVCYIKTEAPALVSEPLSTVTDSVPEAYDQLSALIRSESVAITDKDKQEEPRVLNKAKPDCVKRKRGRPPKQKNKPVPVVENKVVTPEKVPLVVNEPSPVYICISETDRESVMSNVDPGIFIPDEYSLDGFPLASDHDLGNSCLNIQTNMVDNSKDIKRYAGDVVSIAQLSMRVCVGLGSRVILPSSGVVICKQDEQTSKQTGKCQKEEITQAPKPEELTQAPKQEELTQAPKPEELTQAPKPEELTQAPKPEELTQAPKPEELTQAPKPEELTQAPKQEELTQAPKPEELTQAPKPEELTQAPKPEELTQAPKPEELTQAPKPEELTQAPKPEELTQAPKPEELTQAPKPEELTQAPKLEELTQAPKPEELTQAPKLEELTQAPKPEELTQAPKLEELTQAPKPEELTQAPKPEELTQAPKPEELTQAPVVQHKADTGHKVKKQTNKKDKKDKDVLKKTSNKDSIPKRESSHKQSVLKHYKIPKSRGSEGSKCDSVKDKVSSLPQSEKIAGKIRRSSSDHKDEKISTKSKIKSEPLKSSKQITTIISKEKQNVTKKKNVTPLHSGFGDEKSRKSTVSTESMSGEHLCAVGLLDVDPCTDIDSTKLMAGDGDAIFANWDKEIAAESKLGHVKFGAMSKIPVQKVAKQHKTNNKSFTNDMCVKNIGISDAGNSRITFKRSSTETKMKSTHKDPIFSVENTFPCKDENKVSTVSHHRPYQFGTITQKKQTGPSLKSGSNLLFGAPQTTENKTHATTTPGSFTFGNLPPLSNMAAPVASSSPYSNKRRMHSPDDQYKTAKQAKLLDQIDGDIDVDKNLHSCTMNPILRRDTVHTDSLDSPLCHPRLSINSTVNGGLATSKSSSSVEMLFSNPWCADTLHHHTSHDQTALHHRSHDQTLQHHTSQNQTPHRDRSHDQTLLHDMSHDHIPLPRRSHDQTLLHDMSHDHIPLPRRSHDEAPHRDWSHDHIPLPCRSHDQSKIQPWHDDDALSIIAPSIADFEMEERAPSPVFKSPYSNQLPKKRTKMIVAEPNPSDPFSSVSLPPAEAAMLSEKHSSNAATISQRSSSRPQTVVSRRNSADSQSPVSRPHFSEAQTVSSDTLNVGSGQNLSDVTDLVSLGLDEVPVEQTPDVEKASPADDDLRNFLNQKHSATARSHTPHDRDVDEFGEELDYDEELETEAESAETQPDHHYVSTETDYGDADDPEDDADIDADVDNNLLCTTDEICEQVTDMISESQASPLMYASDMWQQPITVPQSQLCSDPQNNQVTSTPRGTNDVRMVVSDSAVMSSDFVMNDGASSEQGPCDSTEALTGFVYSCPSNEEDNEDLTESLCQELNIMVESDEFAEHDHELPVTTSVCPPKRALLPTPSNPQLLGLAPNNDTFRRSLAPAVASCNLGNQTAQQQQQQRQPTSVCRGPVQVPRVSVGSYEDMDMFSQSTQQLYKDGPRLDRDPSKRWQFLRNRIEDYLSVENVDKALGGYWVYRVVGCGPVLPKVVMNLMKLTLRRNPFIPLMHRFIRTKSVLYLIEECEVLTYKKTKLIFDLVEGMEHAFTEELYVTFTRSEDLDFHHYIILLRTFANKKQYTQMWEVLNQAKEGPGFTLPAELVDVLLQRACSTQLTKMTFDIVLVIMQRVKASELQKVPLIDRLLSRMCLKYENIFPDGIFILQNCLHLLGPSLQQRQSEAEMHTQKPVTNTMSALLPNPSVVSTEDRQMARIKESVSHEDWVFLGTLILELMMQNPALLGTLIPRIAHTMYAHNPEQVDAFFDNLCDVFKYGNLQAGPSDLAEKNLAVLGIRLVHKCRADKKYRLGFNILTDMHIRQLRYCQQDADGLTNHIGRFLATMIALDVCLELKEVQAAGYVLNSSDWVRPAPGEERQDQHQMRIQSLLRLLDLCDEKDNITFAYKTYFNLLSTYYSDIEEFPNYPQIREFQDIYEQMIKLAIRGKSFKMALDVLRSFRQMKEVIQPTKEMVRMLLNVFYNNAKKPPNGMEIAQEVYLIGYSLDFFPPVRLASRPYNIRVMTWMTCGEIHMSLIYFFSLLNTHLKMIRSKGAIVTCEHYEVQVMMERYGNAENAGPTIDAAADTVAEALKNFRPPLEVTECLPSILTISSRSVQAYLAKQDLNATPQSSVESAPPMNMLRRTALNATGHL